MINTSKGERRLHGYHKLHVFSPEGFGTLVSLAVGFPFIGL